MSEKELIDDIERLIYDGKAMTDVIQIKNISRNLADKLVNSLNDPNSEHYNPNRYKKLKDQQNINATRKSTKGSIVIPKEEYKNYIDKIESYIFKGYFLNAIADELKISKDYVKTIINALNNPNLDIYNPDRYKKMKEQQKENMIQNLRKINTSMPEEEYKNYIDQIEALIFQGYFLSEIANVMQIKQYQVEIIIKALNNPNSDIYNSERYNKIKNKQKENVLANTRKIVKPKSKIGDINKEKYIMAKLVAANEINVFEAAQNVSTSLLHFLQYLSKIQDPNLSNQLRPILNQYGFGLEKPKNFKSLKEYPVTIQKELMLMALTYRVSFETMAKMFHSTVEDVIDTFLNFDSLEDSLEYLFLETYNEDATHKQKAYNDAKNYWHQRNELVNFLNEVIRKQKLVKESKNSKDEIQSILAQLEEAKIAIKQQIEALYSLIDDTLLFEICKKSSQSLTLEEENLIARYLLKYYLSLNQSGERLKIDKKRISRYRENLEQDDVIFAAKMVLYHKVYDDRSESYKISYNSNFSRGGVLDNLSVFWRCNYD